MKLASLLKSADLNSFCVLETHLKILQSATKLASFLFYKKGMNICQKDRIWKTGIQMQICLAPRLCIFWDNMGITDTQSFLYEFMNYFRIFCCIITQTKSTKYRHSSLFFYFSCTSQTKITIQCKKKTMKFLLFEASTTDFILEYFLQFDFFQLILFKFQLYYVILFYFCLK